MTLDKLRILLADTAAKPSREEIREARIFTRQVIAENRELFNMLAKL